MLAIWLLPCWGVDSAVLHRGSFHVVAPFLMNIWKSQSSLKHQKQVRVDGAWSSPASRKTSNCVRRLTTSVWFHQRVTAWALRFPHCCCCSQCRSGSCTHRHHPADLLARSSNWVNNITLMRISEYVYTQNQKLTFHVSKKSQITGSLTGQITPPPSSEIRTHSTSFCHHTELDYCRSGI